MEGKHLFSVQLFSSGRLKLCDPVPPRKAPAICLSCHKSEGSLSTKAERRTVVIQRPISILIIAWLSLYLIKMLKYCRLLIHKYSPFHFGRGLTAEDVEAHTPLGQVSSLTQSYYSADESLVFVWKVYLIR